MDYAFYYYFFILFKSSGLQSDTKHLDFFYFITFVIIYVFPVIVINNTIGKSILKLHWSNKTSLKLKLCIKYFIYYLALAPSFSIISALAAFPFINAQIGEASIFITPIVFFIYVVVDIVILMISLGRYHISDYILNLSFEKYPYKRKPFIGLGIIYLFFGALFITSIFQYKYNISSSGISTTLNSIIFKEQYPSDLYYGNHVFILKDNSQNVFSPSKPLSFLFTQKICQKTIYLQLPKSAFNSESERRIICLDLVRQSTLNDFFSDYKPTQTRIVLSNIERGLFLEYYNYLYIYYFDNYLPDWNIYGGIVADSATMKEYINFKNNRTIAKIRDIEKKLNLNWDAIISKIEKDRVLEKKILSLFVSDFYTRILNDRIEIKMDTSTLTLRKIDFSKTKGYGFMNFNFPISDLEQKVNFTNLLNGQLIEYDENVNYLMLLRKEITNEGL